MIAVLLIGAILWVAGGFAGWALCAYAGRLDDEADARERGVR